MRLVGGLTSDEADALLSREWLGEWLETLTDIASSGYRLVAGSACAPIATAQRGRIVCGCHNVAENEIAACFAAGDTLLVAQKKLKCGTGCGSCMPELKKIERIKRIERMEQAAVEIEAFKPELAAA